VAYGWGGSVPLRSEGPVLDRRLVILFLIVFISLSGIGIVIPLLPFFGERVGAGPELITMMVAVFALGQFLGSPIWGRLSDRLGRKPALTLSLAGAAGSYILLAFADSIETLILARLISGLMAGNVAVAFASITDITTPKERPKAMGRLGAAFALGFIVGPALGGLLSGADTAGTDFVLVASIAAAMNGLAALATLLIFVETREAPAASAGEGGQDAETGPGRSGNGMAPAPAGGWREIFGNPAFLRLLAMNFLVFSAISMFESTFSLLAYMRHGLGPSDIGFLFTLLGVASVITQLTAVGPIVGALGNRWALRLSIAVYGVGLTLVGLAGTLTLLIVGLIVCAASNALFIPTANTVASERTSPENRGSLLGAFQASGNLGRALPPFLAGWVFAQIGMGVPYFLGAGLVAAALALLIATGARRAG